MNRKRKEREIWNFLAAVWVCLVPVATVVCFWTGWYNLSAAFWFFAYWNMMIWISGSRKEY